MQEISIVEKNEINELIEKKNALNNLAKQFFVLQFWGHIVDATLLYMFLKGEQ